MSDGTSSRFCYVDTAVGGEDHRNRVMCADKFNPRPGAMGCYRTYLRYDAGLLTWRNSHRNAKGNPTVSGYRGPCTSLILPFDIDQLSLDEALTVARQMVDWLANRWNIPAESLRIIFSGGKGFHVEVWATLFGGFAPSEHVPARLYRLACALLEGMNLPIDEHVYDHLRLWRWPNSVHERAKRYAVPLTADELLALDVAGIVALAHQPRTVHWLPAEEWMPRPELVNLWQQTANGSTVVYPQKRAEPFSDKIKAGAGRRHQALLSMAGTLRHRGLGADTIGRMLLIFNEDIFDEPAPEADVLKIAESIAQYPTDAAEAVAARLAADPSPACYVPSTVKIEVPGRPPGVRLGELVRR